MLIINSDAYASGIKHMVFCFYVLRNIFDDADVIGINGDEGD